MTEIRNVERNGEALSEPVGPTTARLAGMAHDTINRVVETANQAEHGIRGAAEKTTEVAKNATDQVGAAADESLRNLRSYVEQNPLASAGIAFAVGALLSAVIRR